MKLKSDHVQAPLKITIVIFKISIMEQVEVQPELRPCLNLIADLLLRRLDKLTILLMLIFMADLGDERAVGADGILTKMIICFFGI